MSTATTYFVEPLAEDGLPDYRAIILGTQSAPPHDQNAAIPLLQATWGIKADNSLNQLISKELGIEPFPLSDDEFDIHNKRLWQPELKKIERSNERQKALETAVVLTDKLESQFLASLLFRQQLRKACSGISIERPVRCI